MHPNYLGIDEEGFFISKGLRYSDAETNKQLFTNLVREEPGMFKTSFHTPTTQEVFLEPFDEPFVAHQISLSNSDCRIILPSNVEFSFDLKSLTLDEWDRFHGRTHHGIPFVFSRAAQAEFFRSLEDFDDESITYGGQRFEIPSWLASEPKVTEKDWSERYRQALTPWDFGGPHPNLKEILAQLKLPKSRIMVLGCGNGHDAAYLAQAGHIVTGVDFSPLAIKNANDRYGNFPNLKFLCEDAFNLSANHFGQYDLVFEHTFFCAVAPDSRTAVVNTWKRLLNESGQLFGIFLVLDAMEGPPFKSTEWELRERLKKSFSFLYWTRFKFSPEKRRGIELVLLAPKKKVGTT